ncbi:MAG: prepilin-type N-terminal cleavage/methylation domain-containing protein [Desulfobulbaceae bacterium]|jgi:type II secretory pathway pseudopilin PulG|nr:prepilin-type N-terminal cleavage/methylation domain-containing protein [Desulfobulbaceae bacterium]
MSKRTHRAHPVSRSAGFTLVELMMALVIAMLAMSAILVANAGQHRTYNSQLQIADARQKTRAVIAMLRADLLMADTFTVAQPTAMTFTRADGLVIAYTWVAADSNGNGITPELMREEGTAGPEVFAEGIDGIEFFYRFDAAPPTTAPAPAQFSDISSVTLSIVGQAGGPDPRYSDSDTYVTASGNPWVQTAAPAAGNLNNAPLNDNFHRRFWRETVACRNMAH